MSQKRRGISLLENRHPEVLRLVSRDLTLPIWGLFFYCLGALCVQSRSNFAALYHCIWPRISGSLRGRLPKPFFVQLVEGRTRYILGILEDLKNGFNLRHIANEDLTAGLTSPHSWHPDTKYSLESTLSPGTGSAIKPRTADNTSVGARILSVVWGTMCLDSCTSYLYCNMLCVVVFAVVLLSADCFLRDKASVNLFVLFADILGCPQLRQSMDTLCFCSQVVYCFYFINPLVFLRT